MMRQQFDDPANFDRVERVPLRGRSLVLEIGHLEGRRELVAIEGQRAELQEALDLFERWHDRPAELLEIREVPEDTPPILVRLGDVRGILYASDKWGGREYQYIHETETPFPELFATPDGTRFAVLGGGMIATAAGLEG